MYNKYSVIVAAVQETRDDAQKLVLNLVVYRQI